ncbi:hypothetical protein PsAD2_02694 [Pseudovibrio axinellae]|uniref:DUF3429 domain-containing protein n=1 Tax=Pseudovibrio axinellae TaxID=989403 RepID=A0A165XR57_9HYPH|nr:DUF3429 domain-containing protein [Pseudovibrio axinellae]KZL17961.1 hypothetical protein PsAD2_02694 [Pseudovibrio axinellae]SER15212.1 Protein of unknown function [Pseudovibrio axinellae]
MTRELPALYSCLALAGTLPFIAGAVGLSAGYTFLPIIGATVIAVSLYALVILSFMAGIHWGMFFIAPHPSLGWLLIWSNFVALAGWFLFLFTAPVIFFLGVIILFSATMLVDFLLHNLGIISRNYLGLRVLTTIITLIALIAITLKL